MGVKRVVDTAFWTDEKVLTMYSQEDKLFFLYLLTNPHATLLGVYKIHPKQMAFEIGCSNNAVSVLLDRFATKYENVRYNSTTCEIAVKNALRYSVIKGGKPVYDLLVKEAGIVKDKSLVKYVAEAAADTANETVRSFIAGYCKDVCVSDSIVYVYVDSSANRGRIADESYHESSPVMTEQVPPIKEKNTKHKHGEYMNVLLTDDELARLKDAYPGAWTAMIENLSGYIASKGDKYKSHYATMRNWASKDAANKPKPASEKVYEEAYGSW